MIKEDVFIDIFLFWITNLFGEKLGDIMAIKTLRNELACARCPERELQRCACAR
jgi:hypothetical protein